MPWYTNRDDVLSGLAMNSTGGNSLVFVKELEVSGMTPTVGSYFGGTAIAFKGSGFDAHTRVTIGGRPCTISNLTTSHLECYPEHVSCPPGWYQYSSSCYRYDSRVYTPKDSNQVCRAHGAHLVTVNDRREETFVTTLVTKFGTRSDVNIGLNDETSENKWVWEDGSEASYMNWAAGFPQSFEQYPTNTADCVSLQTDVITGKTARFLPNDSSVKPSCT